CLVLWEQQLGEFLMQLLKEWGWTEVQQVDPLSPEQEPWLALALRALMAVEDPWLAQMMLSLSLSASLALQQAQEADSSTLDSDSKLAPQVGHHLEALA